MYWEEKMLNKIIGYVLFSLVGISFVFCLLTGTELEQSGNIVWTGDIILFYSAWSVLGGVFLGCVSCYLIYMLGPSPEIDRLFKNKSDLKPFFVTVLLCLIGWLPYFLAYYPGICAYDAVTQIGQIETGAYVEHHPLAHTLLIKACLNAGQLWFHNANAGVAVYSLLQMLMLSLSFGYCILVLVRYGVDKRLRYVMMVLFAVYPFSGYLSISMTKDIIFTAFFVTGALAFVQMVKPVQDKLTPGAVDALFVVCAVGMVLFRNNGKYALLVLTVMLLVPAVFCMRRKGYVRLLTECVISLVVGVVLLSAISKSVNAVQADRREMLSMPIQQLSRCMLYHGGEGILAEDDGTMKEEDKALIKELFKEDGYKEYLPFISDPVKNKTVTSVVRYQPKRFLTTYFRLLTMYPGDFVNAGMALDAGYLNPLDQSHARVYQIIYPDMEGKGYVQTQWWESVVKKTGITHESKLPMLQEKMERFANDNGYLSIPILKFIFVPGIWLWWDLILLCIFLVRKDKGMSLVMFLVLGYFGTLILGPVVQLRYIYPCMIITPILTLVMNAKGREQW